MSKCERKVRVERIHVKTPHTKRVRELIEHCHEYSKIAADPECMLLLGDPGNGKTTECKRYARDYPRRIVDGRTILPVLYVSIPSPTTTKSLPEKILRQMGDGFWKEGNTTVQTLRLCGLLDDTQTELIILDEFQGFIDGKTDRAVLEVSNWLKGFINEARKPVIVAGLPYCDIVLKANDQLERRFPIRETLHPFGWNTAKNISKFKMFLEQVDKSLPFDVKSNLADDHIARRMYVATNGVIDFVMKLVRRAAELAIDKDVEKIELGLLERAYRERIKAIVPNRPNPFSICEEDLEPKPFPKSILGVMATNRRSKAQNREMSVSETFSRS
jgi:Cdc6-like AAA superfamily ATPase